MAKRTLVQLIEKHEKDATYAKAKAREWSEKATKSQAKADALREQIKAAAAAL